ncbi:Rid family detoxifying hydrolase [Pseudocolwellia sp. AS88]|uniref:RidA family protein n=1 Tax=Pseudocolwellia sp. AS88 TaxID=3063958 RepID=UPI0026EAF9DB|nr:Rid family detoxifying hydrolase [Pseudocolwellia sp. AS88]MDO7084465.1 Rid family detoxifying hydrolase [Pseudocolwellia sp. AS88]
MKKLSTIITLATLLFTSHLYAGSSAKVEYLDTSSVFPKSANMPFSEAVRVDNTLYISGQLAVTPGTLKLVEGGIDAETTQTMNNIKTILAAHDLTMKNVVKCTVMLADMKDWPRFNEIYTSFFSKPYPARSAFGANGLGLGAKVEVECIAVFS